MGSSEFVPIFINALKNVVQGAKVVTIVDVCARILGMEVTLPIQLPKVSLSERFLRSKVDEIREAFISITKEMGYSEVVAPRIENCELTFKNVKVDDLNVKIDAYSIIHNVWYVVLAIDVASFPIAWMGVGDGDVEYRDKVQSVLLTALFVAKNPWVTDAVKRTLERTFKNVLDTYGLVADFYNTLRLLGAEER